VGGAECGTLQAASIQDELRRWSQNLSGSPTHLIIEETRANLAQARSKAQKVTRSTMDIDNLKRNVAEQMNNIEGRLIELDALSPQVGPKDYLTGE